ncbi:MAG: RNA helicase [Deltaproteobacteria bacterium]|nr:MAG: RNA helicase [Deltaproteobacteria bacterium]
MSFKSLQLHEKIASNIKRAGYEQPTPIQAASIPMALSGQDILGIAETGTGKTAAFVLPILQRLINGPRNKVRALIVAPTRELAEQIHESIAELGRKTGLRSMTIYGGVGFQPQVDKLRRGFEIVVACPGRLLDHAGRKTINLSGVEVLVLDEADRMFDMGFLPEVRKIAKLLPEARQTLLFSATMPNEVRHLADEVLKNPETVKVSQTAMADTVRHSLFPVDKNKKGALLLELLATTDTKSVLIFTRTKHLAQRIAEKLAKKGHKATSLQGNLSQNRRQAAMKGFKDGTYTILVATDIAARGIDIATVSHVINYDMPRTVEDYTHRTGRTGRARRSGDAFSMITGDDRAVVRQIEKILRAKIERRAVEGLTSNAA